MEPLISVIVPIYNVEKYLRVCLDSILGQTYTALELILVDDGSPDGCGAICDQYAAMDARIKVIHKENGGLSDARNAGLEIATGEYISFIDSDDWIDRDLYRKAMALAPFSAIIFGCTDVDAHTGIMTPNRATDENMTIRWCSDGQVIERLVERSLFGYSCNKIYHRTVIGDIRFKKIPLREDTAFNLEVFARTETLTLLDMPGYYYNHRGSSLLTGRYSGPVPDIAETAKLFLTIHPGLDRTTERAIANNIIKTYILDALHKYVFLNRALDDEQRKALLRPIIQDRQLRDRLHMYPNDRNLFRLLTLAYKLRWPSLLYCTLKRMWKP